MTALVYEDVHQHEWKGYYAVPNEDTLSWRELLKKDKPIYRAAGICSSGEVGFFSILPLVRRELVLVDHSYRSLQVAALKYLLLKEKGALEARRLLTTAPLDELRQELIALKEHLPEKLQTCHDKTGGLWLGERIARRDSYRRYSDYEYLGFGSSEFMPADDQRQVRELWLNIPPRIINKAAQKLDRVKFLHGDLSDLVQQGPFGLLYLSNAFSHPSRSSGTGCGYNVKESQLDMVHKVVKPGGYVILACNGGFDNRYNPDGPKGNPSYHNRGWTLLDTRYVSSWSQQLWRLPS